MASAHDLLPRSEAARERIRYIGATVVAMISEALTAAVEAGETAARTFVVQRDERIHVEAIPINENLRVDTIIDAVLEPEERNSQ